MEKRATHKLTGAAVIMLLVAGLGGCERAGLETESYQFEVACDIAEVAAALSIMEGRDTIRHEPCESLEDEQAINALYDRDMRERE